MNEESFTHFLNSYYERTVRILANKLGDIASAEDKAQEIFTNIYNNSPQNPKAYLWTCIRNARNKNREILIGNADLDFRERVEKELSVDFQEYWDKIKKMEFLGSETCGLTIFFCYIEENSKKSEVAKQFNLDPKTLSTRIAEIKKRIAIAIYLLQGESLQEIFDYRKINLPQQKITEIYHQIKQWLGENKDE
ncbi:RNA polymerase sigma factor [Candidatus Uabimicrobium sp. HlEnr_7]|uniref:RNA polymerase sigma factor n=1 Tax=Candidatus Uabimicrobium helgolandensis TaxID=3095367 RepID=UPI003558B28E